MTTTKVQSSIVIQAVTGFCLVLLILLLAPKVALGGPETTPSKRGASVEMTSLKRAPVSWLQFVRFAAGQSLRIMVRFY